jgi:hypothetical protein
MKKIHHVFISSLLIVLVIGALFGTQSRPLSQAEDSLPARSLMSGRSPARNSRPAKP